MSESSFNARYGVDPATPRDRRDLCDLVRLFGPSEGRFIVEYPLHLWREAFLSHAKSLSDDQFHLAVGVVERLSHALLAENQATQWAPTRSWAENAAPLKSRLGWMDLLGPPGSPATVKVFQRLLDEPQPLPPSRGALIPMTARAYANAARPLLMTSPKVILVDKFFHPDNDWDLRRRILVELLRTAQTGAKVRYFEVRNGLQGAALSRCKVELDACNHDAGTTSRVEISVLPIVGTDASGAGITRHARYLLGNHSGLRFDHGFVESRSSRDKPGLNDVHWLDAPVWTALWAHYG